MRLISLNRKVHYFQKIVQNENGHKIIYPVFNCVHKYSYKC